MNLTRETISSARPDSIGLVSGVRHSLLELLKAKPNRIVFGKPSPQERETARKRVAEAEAAPVVKAAEPVAPPR